MRRVILALVAIGALLAPLPAAALHPRPKAATPVMTPLVTAYAPCAAADRMHGPPLAFPSCSQPQQASAYLTVGTPDANGSAAKSVGSLRVRAHAGVPGPPTDNVTGFELSITDVRCVAVSAGCPGAGEDFSGSVEVRISTQWTDHTSASAPGGGTEPATMEPYTLAFEASCTATADPTIGATCSRLIRYIEELLPAGIADSKRTLIEFGGLQLWDGGADGDGSTHADNTLFAVQGIFVP